MASYIAAAKLIELLIAANSTGQMNVQVLEADQLALGVDPRNPSCIIDLSKEVVRPLAASVDHRTLQLSPGLGALIERRKLSRKSGTYLMEIEGETAECTTLKELLANGLRSFEKRQPGTLDKLSKVKPRTRRIVAREPSGLFDQPELAEKYSEKLMPGWWYGTNNSKTETIAWLKRGCALSGLQWGRDFMTSL